VGAPALPATPGFDANRDAEELRYAMKGLGTDDSKLINIVTKRHPHELQTIRNTYRTKFNRDLIPDIHAETSGDYREVLEALFQDSIHFDAYCLNRAMKGAGTNDTCLIEILVSRTNAELQQIKQVYQSEQHKSLEAAVSSETSGDYKEFLLRLCAGRDEGTAVIDNNARQDAERLYRAGEGRMGTDEKTFIDIFTRNNLAQLKAIADHYPNTHVNKKHRNLFQAIDSEFSGSIKTALLAYLTVAMYGRMDYWVESIYKAMKGAGTDDFRLWRVTFTAWNRGQLAELKSKFRTKYGKSLKEWVHSETSGNYRNALLQIIGDT
jgi:annexin A7/11